MYANLLLVSRYVYSGVLKAKVCCYVPATYILKTKFAAMFPLGIF